MLVQESSPEAAIYPKSGELVDQVTEDMIALGMILRQQTVTTTEIRMLAFFDNVVLEDIQSPYKHGFIPFVPFICYYQGEDDIPSGVVRDLKDPQREINKRRSQELHILNTQSNGGWISEEGAMSPQQEASLRGTLLHRAHCLKSAPARYPCRNCKDLNRKHRRLTSLMRRRKR